MPTDRHRRGLNVGFFCGSKSRYTLATIGRCGDIVVKGEDISRIQCSFEMHEGNMKEIMLQDRSVNRSTQLFGDSAMPFEPRRAHRRVVVDPYTNRKFGFGGAACDQYLFRIVWHKIPELGINFHTSYRDHPRHTRTPIHTPGPEERMWIRYSKREKLGSGSFGEVWKVVNIDSGEYLAVKHVTVPDIHSQEYVRVQREVKTLSCVSYQGHHSRDVKPENILYTPTPDGDYLYQLADFGLANIASNARTFAGSNRYMAPELENGLQQPQTPNMDVWSLFVTLAYAMNVADFRAKDLYTTPQRIKAIQEAANDRMFQRLRDMAFADPGQRATAGDMLDKLFNGLGRITPRNRMLLE
ncbi:hypothetical protein QQS21_002014 [Conoideocrella luteorostrata]|uniref:mitogen-activated protein kinase kinase n=1 Tax=Conoideocrella luteorostrata TaxID=1105319 RepID=A0AAJ0FXM7_9HYPO|nr:hypothetical protein QQS21_002014 [Conoideocrella luteorostrata]